MSAVYSIVTYVRLLILMCLVILVLNGLVLERLDSVLGQSRFRIINHEVVVKDD